MPVERSSPLLTIEEAARYLNVSKTSLRRWTNTGKLTCHRVGMRQERRFAVADLDRFLNNPLIGDVMTRAETLGNGNRHICLHYNDSDEQWRLFRPYVIHHLERKAPVLFFYDETPLEQVEEWIRAEGYNPRELADQQMLVLVPSMEAYLPDGYFSTESMIEFLGQLMANFATIGHSKVLMSGEMTWSLADPPGVEELMGYENQLNSLIANYRDLTIICQYSLNRFDSATTLQAICQHTVVQHRLGASAGFYSPS